MKLLMPNWYQQHILRRPPREWPEPVLRADENMNRKFYVTMQGPSEMGASGRLANWDRFNDLKRIQIPTLVISGQVRHDGPGLYGGDGEAAAARRTRGDQRRPYGHVRRPADLFREAERVPAEDSRRASTRPPCASSARGSAWPSRRCPSARSRSTARLSASTSRVMTDPAPTIAPSPMVTGATSARVGADERARADHRAIFAEAVIIAGDRARADVGLGADRGVADVGQMVDLGALADLGLLELDEIADLGPFARAACRGGSARTGRCSPSPRSSRLRYG